ncbi:MAG: aminomethyltransferase family protein [Pseudomonadota bacterium]
MSIERLSTPLNAWHRSQGANMADFGGYDMPLWYPAGVKKEHLAVLESAGLFDTSHMACVMVSGPGAFALLQRCHTRDLLSLKTGRCVYGAVLNSKGHVIDDAIVYRLAETNFMVCVNAGMGAVVAEHLASNRLQLDVDIQDMTGKIGKIDIQGRQSARILAKILKSPESVFSAMPYFSFKGHFNSQNPLSTQVRLKDDTPVLLSRSGYTGEFGFELFLPEPALVSVWTQLLAAGEPERITPCGLGARDSLRTGAVLPLSHQDIGAWPFINHPWMFALPLVSDAKSFTKEFIGRDALMNLSAIEYTYAFVGKDLRKVGTGEDTQVIDNAGTVIGRVLSCATDMGITWHENKIVSIATPGLPENLVIKGLSCGYVKVDKSLEAGAPLILQEKKRQLPVIIVNDIRPDRTARKKLSDFI